MNVLSLFDGMSCGRIALEREGFRVNKYYAAEVDKYAIQVSNDNYPDIVRLGDVNHWQDWDFDHGIDWASIDLLIAGSPCQGFSFAGKQLAFDDPRSKLFFVFVDILHHINEERRKVGKEPVKFMLENVRMKKEFLEIISDELGVQPVFIDSALMSAQNRQRYYWCNWAVEQPEDRGLVLADIVELQVDQKYQLSDKLLAGYARKQKRRESLNSGFDKMNVRGLEEKCSTLTARMHKMAMSDPSIKCGSIVGRRIDPETGKRCDNNKDIPAVQRLEIRADGKSGCLTSVQKDNVVVVQRGRGKNKGGLKALDGKTPSLTSSKWQDNNHIKHGVKYRKLTPIECERLQTVPDNYTQSVSNTQRYKMLGNGWTVDVIGHIFNSMLDDML